VRHPRRRAARSTRGLGAFAGADRGRG
jgi:hypothetical protein